MTIKIKTVVSVVVLFALFACMLPQSVSARTNVRFRQRIKPIPCGIDHLTDPDGTEHYFAPHACGKLIVPSATTSTGSSSSTGAGGIVGIAPIYLDTKNHVAGQQAYLIAAKKGQIYTFRLTGDSTLSPLRTIEVLDVTQNSVTLMFTPGDKEITLPIGGKIDADIAFGQDPDVNIRVRAITKDGMVSMLIWFPMQRQLAGVADDTMHSTAAVAIIGTLATAAGILHFHSRRRLHTMRVRNKLLT